MADNYPPLPAGFEVVEEQPSQETAAMAVGATPVATAQAADASAVPALPPGFQLLPDDYGSGSIDVDITGGSRQSSQTAVAAEPAGPYAGSLFNKAVELFSGPAPLQGDTAEARKADYESRPALVRAATGVGQFVDSNIQGISQLTGTQTPGMADQGDFAGGVADGDTLTNAARIGTELGAWALPFLKAAKIPTLAGRLGASSALGAVQGGIKETRDGESRGLNSAFGAAGGGLGELGGSALRAAGNKISPAMSALYNDARKYGINLTPAQLSNSQFVKRAQNILTNMPLSGATKAWEGQVEQFNRAVSREFGENAPKITPEVFASAKSRIGGEFDQLSAKSNMRLTDDLLNRLGGLQEEAAAFADEGVVRAVGSAVDRMLKQSKDGVLPGRAYKSLDSTLGKIMASGGEKSFFIGQVRDAMREAMDESIDPAMRQAWQQARSQYRALKTVEPLVAKSADGSISPAQLMGRVTANNAGKSAMASGRGGNLGDLARVGQAMKLPSSSGTAENMLAAQSLNPLAWPLMLGRGAVGATLGRASNSNALARLMADPQTRVPVANALARIMGPGGAAAVPAVAAPVVSEKPRRDNGR